VSSEHGNLLYTYKLISYVWQERLVTNIDNDFSYVLAAQQWECYSRHPWFSATTAWRVLELRVEERPPDVEANYKNTK
jgi:hypothetical protein